MMSLQTSCLVVLTAKCQSLAEVLEFCRQNSLLEHSVWPNSNFWKFQLRRFCGDHCVLQRGDLETGSDWLNFVQALLTGVEYRYLVEKPFGELLRKPQPYLSSFGGRTFQIAGLLPRAGTKGYFVRCECSGPENGGHEWRSFSLGSDMKEAKRRVAVFAAEKFVHTYQHHLAPPFDMEIEEGEQEISWSAFPNSIFLESLIITTVDGGSNIGSLNMRSIRTDDAVYFSWLVCPIEF
jgi:hypothetical protein